MKSNIIISMLPKKEQWLTTLNYQLCKVTQYFYTAKLVTVGRVEIWQVSRIVQYYSILNWIVQFKHLVCLNLELFYMFLREELVAMQFSKDWRGSYCIYTVYKRKKEWKFSWAESFFFQLQHLWQIVMQLLKTQCFFTHYQPPALKIFFIFYLWSRMLIM